MHQHENDSGKLEELGELDFYTQERQFDGRFEKQIGVRDARDRDHQIGHDAQEDQPGGMGGVGRVVDGLEQAVGVDGGLDLHRAASHFVHQLTPHSSSRARATETSLIKSLREMTRRPPRSPDCSDQSLAEKVWRESH